MRRACRECLQSIHIYTVLCQFHAMNCFLQSECVCCEGQHLASGMCCVRVNSAGWLCLGPFACLAQSLAAKKAGLMQGKGCVVYMLASFVQGTVSLSGSHVCVCAVVMAGVCCRPFTRHCHVCCTLEPHVPEVSSAFMWAPCGSLTALDFSGTQGCVLRPVLTVSEVAHLLARLGISGPLQIAAVVMFAQHWASIHQMVYGRQLASTNPLGKHGCVHCSQLCLITAGACCGTFQVARAAIIA